MPAEDASPPRIACVQDIRPHVPELGCTSAVQNEKMYFSFFVQDNFWHVQIGKGSTPQKSRLDALTCKYMNTTNKSIANLGYSQVFC